MPPDDVLPELPPIQRRALEAALLLGESEPHADDRAVAAASWERCDCSPRDSPLCLAVDDLQWLDAASLAALRYALARFDRRAGRRPAGGPRRRAGVASPRRARGTAADGRGRRPEPGRDPRAAARPPRRDIPAADADQALGDLARQPLLRARARKRAPAQRRHARARRGAPDSLRPRRAPARAHRRPRPRGARGRARRRGARRPDRHPRGKSTSALAATLGSPRRSTRGSSSSTASGFDSRIRCSVLRSPHAKRPRAAGRSTHGSRSRPVRRGTRAAPCARHGRARPRGRRDPRGAARAAHARGAPAAAAELAEQALRLTPAASPTTRAGASSSPPTCTPRRRHGRAIALLEQARAAAAPGNERARSWFSLPAFRRARETAVALYREALARRKATTRSQATIHLGLAALMRCSDGRRARHRARRARRPRRLARRRRPAPVPRARGLRPMHFIAGRGIPRRDGGGARTRAVACRAAARRRTDGGLGYQLGVVSGYRRARGGFSTSSGVRKGAERSCGRGMSALAPWAFSNGGQGTGRRPTGTRPTRWTCSRSSASRCRPTSFQPP